MHIEKKQQKKTANLGKWKNDILSLIFQSDTNFSNDLIYVDIWSNNISEIVLPNIQNNHFLYIYCETCRLGNLLSVRDVCVNWICLEFNIWKEK